MKRLKLLYRIEFSIKFYSFHNVNRIFLILNFIYYTFCSIFLFYIALNYIALVIQIYFKKNILCIF